MNGGRLARGAQQLATRGSRSFASHGHGPGAKPAHVHMPETAMLTANVRGFLQFG